MTASISDDGRGDGQGVVAEVKVDNGNDESGFEADVKPNIREIGKTAKPPVRFNKKKKRDAEHLQMQMISMLEQEDNEIDLVFHAMSKRIKKNLTDEETEDLMEELNSVVTKHVRQAWAKKNQPQRNATPSVAPPTTTPPPPPPTPTTQIVGLPPMPNLQRMSYDRELTYQQL